MIGKHVSIQDCAQLRRRQDQQLICRDDQRTQTLYGRDFWESTLLLVRFHPHRNTNGQSMNRPGLASIFFNTNGTFGTFSLSPFFRQTFKLWFETNCGLFSRWQGSKHGIFEHHSSAPGISILDSNDRKKSHKTYHQPICREAVSSFFNVHPY